jgi:DNA polymerase I-like protein with 3'-5' exonuclease and polymerase domains
MLELSQLILHSDLFLFWNAKFDIQKLRALGFFIDLKYDEFHDVQVIAQLMYEHQDLTLKGHAERTLGESTDEAKVLAAVRRQTQHPTENRKLKKADGYHLLPREVLIPYAIADARFTRDLFVEYWPWMLTNPDVMPLYDLQRQLILSLLDIEAAGMGIDKNYTKQLYRELGDRTLDITARIKELAGEINPNAPAQLLKAFHKRGIKIENTRKETLAVLTDELAGCVRELRGTEKTRANWISAILSEVKNGIIHPNFKLHTRTGRMASGEAEN